jgi:hypothetical protein
MATAVTAGKVRVERWRFAADLLDRFGIDNPDKGVADVMLDELERAAEHMALGLRLPKGPWQLLHAASEW